MRQAEWLVLQPSFAVFGRCVPYQRPADQSSTKLCASPACEPIVGALPTKPQQVCGLTRDGTDKYWLLEAPDTSIEDGWRAEGADSAVISARATMAGTSKGSDCRQQLRREADVSIRPLDDSVAYNLLTSVTSPVYSVGNSISSNYALILGLGVGGSAVMSVIIMLLFPICAPPVLLSLLVVVFVALILADYVLFVQGGIASGRTGAQLQQSSTDIHRFRDSASGFQHAEGSCPACPSQYHPVQKACSHHYHSRHAFCGQRSKVFLRSEAHSSQQQPGHNAVVRSLRVLAGRGHHALGLHCAVVGEAV